MFPIQNKIIELKDLSIRFKGDSHSLFENLSFSFYENEILTLIGPSGSGKTSLALALTGLLSKKGDIQGEIEFMDKTWRLGREYTMVFQDPASVLNPFFTIRLQMREVLLRLGVHKDELEEMLHRALKEVQLFQTERILKSYPCTLSGGEKQRVLLAIALLSKPKWVVLDEPCASLDPALKIEIAKMLLEIKALRGLSLLWITHDRALGKRVGDRHFEVKGRTLLSV